MCDASADVPGAGRALPRSAAGAAIDPIALEPVDELLVTTLVDNVYDALLEGDERTQRAPFGVGTAAAPQFEGGRTAVGLVAEHGFAALVTVRRAGATTSLLFDTGLSPDESATHVVSDGSVDDEVFGRAVLDVGFTDNVVVNGEGPDLAVFESGRPEGLLFGI